MDRIKRLPFILGAVMSIIMGAVSSLSGTENQAVFVRMLLTMVIFFVIGVYIKRTVLNIYDEIEESKKKAEAEKKAEEDNKRRQESKEKKNDDDEEGELGRNFNMSAEDDLLSMDITRAISNELED